jgi:small-conductance mechanosensitive channel
MTPSGSASIFQPATTKEQSKASAQSRDWVTDKIAVGVTYDSDLILAKKLIKQIGLDLAKDPEFAPLILEPLKMQGSTTSAISRSSSARR